MKNLTYIVNHWAIDLTSGFIIHQMTQEQKRLGEYQLKLLSVLLEHAGQVLSRDQLTDLVWKRRVIGNNSLPNAIHTLRTALDDKNKQQRIIQTIPKMGYLLDATFCKIIEKVGEAELETLTNSVDNQQQFAPITPAQTVEIAPLVAKTTKNTHTATTQVTILESNNHSLISMPDAIVPHRGIFSSSLSASLLLVIIVIASFSYLLLQRQEEPQYRTIEHSTIQQQQKMYSTLPLAPECPVTE